jgi:hypothetical protein
MKHTAHYIIRANPELKDRLAGTDYADLETLIGPILWTHEQGGRSSFTRQDHIVAVKRLYVEYVRSIVPGAEAVVVADLLSDDAPFDRWWSIEVFSGINNTVEEVARELEEVIGSDRLAKISPIFDEVGTQQKDQGA